MTINRKLCGASLAMLAALGGCAAHHDRLASVAPPVVAPPPLAPMPQPPLGATADMVTPPLLADGSYATPNKGLDAAATVWHLRVALNVAALGCRGADGQAITAGYNALLTRDKAELARANAATIAAEGGQAGYDEAMTRLYNFFAQPGATAAFCAAAAQVIGQMTGAPTLAASAPAALATLDQPFQAFYRAYDGYRSDLASWQAGRMRRALRPLDETPGVALAVAAPAPVAGHAARRPATPHLAVDPAIFRMP